jgi:hypothetical protein
MCPKSFYKMEDCAGILEQFMEARNRAGITLPYRPAGLHRLAGRCDNSVLAPLNCYKIPALDSTRHRYRIQYLCRVVNLFTNRGWQRGWQAEASVKPLWPHCWQLILPRTRRHWAPHLHRRRLRLRRLRLRRPVIGPNLGI